MVALQETKTGPSLLVERDGLQVTRERVDIGSLVLPDTLKARFPTEYDPANIKELAKTIESGILPPHALAVKEVRGSDNTVRLELLHKPSVIFALQKCGISEVDVVVIHNNDDNDDFDILTASDDQLLFLGEQGVLTNHIVRNIPMADVISDESIIDEEYRDVLQAQLSTGQEVNIRVRVRRIGDRIVYDIIDGYHRHDSIRRIGSQCISSRLAFGMTDEELHDERVLQAFRSAKAVKYARMITSMQKSYAETVWKKDYDLRMSQIISWAMNAKKVKQPGKNLAIPEDVVQNAMGWINRKAILWNTEVGSLYPQIRAAENSFWDIIKQVRTSESGGHDSEMAFNASKFVAIAEQLPGDEKLQTMMVTIIKRDNLTTDQVRVISKALAKIRDNSELTEHLVSNPCDLDILSGILGGKVLYIKGKMVHEEKGATAISDPLGDDQEEVLTTHLDELVPIEDAVKGAAATTIFVVPDENSHGDIEDVLPAEMKNVNRVGMWKDIGDHDDYNKHCLPAEYEREIQELQEKLTDANSRLERGARGKRLWYETLATLTPQERDAMRLISKLKKKKMPMNEIDAALAKKLNILPNQVSQLKRSALTRWSLYLGDVLQQEYDQMIVR